MSQAYSSDLQYSKYAINQFHMKNQKNSNWRNCSLKKKGGLKMFQNKTLLILNVIYVNLFICLANVLHAVWKCQKEFKNKLFFPTILY